MELNASLDAVIDILQDVYPNNDLYRQLPYLHQNFLVRYGFHNSFISNHFHWMTLQSLEYFLFWWVYKHT